MISMIIAVNIWLSGFLQPFTGHLLDRYGPKWIFIVSMSTFGIGIGLISLTQSFGFHLALFMAIVVAAAMAGSSNSMTNALVAKWFPSRQRGLAIGINNAGSAVGQLTLVWLTTLMLQVSGWRSSPHLSRLGHRGGHRPSHLFTAATNPRAERGQRRLPRTSPTALGPHWPPSGGQRHSTPHPLWLINAGYFVCGMTGITLCHPPDPICHRSGLFPHRPRPRRLGFCRYVAPRAHCFQATPQIFGAAKNIMALAYFVRGLGFVILLSWRHEFSLYIFAVLGGLSWLATPVSVMGPYQ